MMERLTEIFEVTINWSPVRSEAHERKTVEYFMNKLASEMIRGLADIEVTGAIVTVSQWVNEQDVI